MESYEILWKSILKELENTVNSLIYITYIEVLKPIDIIGDRLILTTSSTLISDTVEQKCAEQIREALRKCNESVTDFSIVIDGKNKNLKEEIEKIDFGNVQTAGTAINPKFTFDSFVVGPTNEFIYAAAKAVAENPGESYNPLFIYGGTGLGKTHILMAIANYIKINKPSLKVLYATCEQFMNQMIDSIGRNKATPQEFRNKYRGVDILLIDDVQFLANKQGTQTEFFHTFNELVMQNKQIVLTSDRPPKEIDVLEERLRTRFEGGLLADVQPPDLETRTAILRRKADELKCVIDTKVLTYIAELGNGDVRTLLGKLTKIVFFSKLHEKIITIDLVNEALKESFNEKQEELKVEDIINCVANFYKISKADILSKKKNKEIVEARQVCIYLISDLMTLPLAAIGQKIGGKDHSTVIYARDKISDQIKTDSKLNTEINDLRKMLLKQ
ncbi:MAG: chromosomal replication initiator protein DnaA [Clostridia bacterium]|nr:chromosomal replication initiator protein DnaA [Clostridia bacterium]